MSALISLPAAHAQCPPHFTFTGQPGDWAGFSVAGGGDVNHDGVGDILIGSIRLGGGGNPPGPGRVTIVSGATGEVLHTISGHTTISYFGASVAFIGDVNGDSADDFIVGAPYELSYAGRAYVYSGADGSQLYRFSGDSPGLGFGVAVAGLGDVDGDGVPDIGITGPGISGGAGGPRVYVLSGRDGSRLWTFFVGTLNTNNRSIADAGDIDGDGHADILVCGSAGFILIYSGRDGYLLSVFSQADYPNVDGFGSSVACLGDINGDDVSDIAVGATSGLVGHVLVLSGSDGAALFTLTDSRTNSGFGRTVASAGDVNGDHVPDLIVGAPAGAPDTLGAAYVYSGRDGCILQRFDATDQNDQIGWAAAGAGDINGDGFDDFVIGAYGHDVNRGLVTVHLGARSPDFNCDGVVNSQDFFAFLTAFFAVEIRADINGDEKVNSQDFFDFLAAFFGGC